MKKEEHIFARNITASIINSRHGPKSEDGTLAEHAEQKIRTRKDTFLHGEVHVNASPMERTQRTGQILADNLTPKGEKTNFTENERHKLHYIDLSRDANSEWFKKYWVGGDDDIVMANARAKNFLTTPEEEFDSYFDGTLSYRQMAQRMARSLFDDVLHINRKGDGTVINVFNITHEPVLLSFLYYALKKEYEAEHGESREMFIDWLGGTVDTAESFNVDFITDQNGYYTLTLEFRTLKKPLNLEWLKGLLY